MAVNEYKNIIINTKQFDIKDVLKVNDMLLDKMSDVNNVSSVESKLIK